MKKLIYTIVLCTFCFIGSLNNIDAYDKDIKKVLFIASYNPSYVTFNDQINGIREQLGNDIIFQIEYMDYKTIDNVNDKHKLYELFKSKIDNYNKFDAIILADDAALKFGVENRDTLFKDTPIVFLGVNDLDLIKEAMDLEEVYGIEENFSIDENLQLISRFHHKKNVIALIDQPVESSKQIKEFYSLEKKYDNINFKHLSSVGISKEELKKELNKLDNDDVVFLMYSYTGRDGYESLIADELNFLTENMDVPIYCSYNLGINENYLKIDSLTGGKVISHYEQGKKAGEIANDLLNGKTPSKRFISKENINKYIFNNTQLKINGIKKRDLPEESIIINDYELFISEYRSIATGIASIILCLIVILIAFILYTIQRLKYERELVNAKKKAESSNEAKTHFISNMSHEFRTPLTLILSANNLLNLNADKCDKPCSISNQNSARIIRQNCYRLIRLTNNIIDITKSDSNFMDVKLTNVNIIYILESIVESTIQHAKGKGIDIIFDTEDEEVIMAVDVDKMERIVLNLISNAIKFSGSGKVIYFNVKVDNDMLVFSVEDEGIGIDEKYLSYIFDKFTQVDNTTFRKNEGSGIGLSLVKLFVNAHGGTIDVESKLNEGSKFIVKLPIKIIESEEVNETDYKSSVITSTNIEFSDIYF